MQLLFTPAAEPARTDRVTRKAPTVTTIRGGLPAFGRGIAVPAVFWLATGLMLYLSGAFNHELGGTPDEAAHFMNGLMIHDYVASGMRLAPLDFATDYYAHYPKLAFGIWPPLFHVMEAGWMLLFSASKVSVLSMLSLITALLAYLLFRVVEQRFGPVAGICAGLLLISAPLMQQSTNLVMVDSSVALFSFLAIIFFGGYLEKGRWSDAALFALCASAAILAKYNGLALVFVPPLCAAFTGKWKLLWRGPVLLAYGIIFVVCGSWYVPMRHLVAYAAEPLPTLRTILPAMRANTAALAELMGLPILIVAVAGAALTLRRYGKRPSAGGIWIPAAALVVSCWAFHSLTIPDPEPRYQLPALAPLILFLAAGIDGLSRRLRCPPPLLAFGLLLAYAAGSFTIMRTPHLGYAEVASAIANQRDPEQRIILADGAGDSEGMAVSEIAIRERRSARYVLRGSKVLARSTWMGTNYRPLYQTTDGMLQALDAMGASAIILQANAPANVPHHRLLAEALRSATGTWKRWSDAAWAHSERHFLVYRRIRPITGPFCVELSLEETLHRGMRICMPGSGELTHLSQSSPTASSMENRVPEAVYE